MDRKASLCGVTLCTFRKGRLMHLILNTCMKTRQKKAKLLLVVLCSGLCWRASWQLATCVCLHKTLQSWPNCSALYLFLAQNAAIQWLIIPSYRRGPVFRTRQTDRLSWRRVFCFFSQFHEDVTGIIPHIFTRLFPSVSFPTYFYCSSWHPVLCSQSCCQRCCINRSQGVCFTGWSLVHWLPVISAKRPCDLLTIWSAVKCGRIEV
jgi:hypothetical protein